MQYGEIIALCGKNHRGHKKQPFCQAKQFLCQSHSSPHFTEPAVSLPCSQPPATCTCHEPHESTPRSHPISLRFTLILSSHVTPRFSMLSLYYTKTLCAFLLSPICANTPHISFYLIKHDFVSSTDHDAPHYAAFSSLLLTSSILDPNIALSIPFLKTHSQDQTDAMCNVL